MFGPLYNAEDGRERLDAPLELLRAMRGGSFTVEPARARSAFRDAVLPTNRDDADGFRIVLTSQIH
jgi:formylglycine-generating enzyme required for sulfatase activity